MVESSVSPERWEVDRTPASTMAGFDGFDGFGQAADLVEFDQQGIGGFFFDSRGGHAPGW